VAYLKSLGADPVATAAATTAASASGAVRDLVTSDAVKTASGIALVYHGYRRTGSIFWALMYGLAGRTAPVVAVPVALAQGYGKRKECP
jgi:hypothetical protein